MFSQTPEEEKRMKNFLKDLRNWALDNEASPHIQYVRVAVLIIQFKDLFFKDKEFMSKFLDKQLF